MSFTAETFEFLKSLKANNTREWFEDNRAAYEAHWRAPALAFIEQLAEPMGAHSLKAEARLNGSLRRINRDTRFSKDKTPYNPSLHMIFWQGSHPNRSPAMHIVLHPDGVGYGAGQFAMTPEELGQARQKIMSDDGCEALVSALASAEAIGCRMGEPDLKRVPKGFDADGQRAEFLRYKGFVARTFDGDASPDAIKGDAGLAWAMAQTEACMPLIRWLSEG